MRRPKSPSPRRAARSSCSWKAIWLGVRRRMKTSYVTDLLSEQTITSFFLVVEKEVRNTREGRSYLRMELGDRSGTIEARMWDQFEGVARDINRDDYVKVQARVEVYKNRPQL